MEPDVKIGLEIHIQLNTVSKLFCSCTTKETKKPNTLTCPTCLGHPGAKPVVNKAAIHKAIRLCSATNCTIAREIVFARKMYFYPDLAKNYQITQHETPLGKNGALLLENEKKITIKRIHIEEDPAALIHPKGLEKSAFVLVDYNRSGVPLVELVTEPVLNSPQEAREFLKKLLNILLYLDMFNIHEGTIKADANISIKETGFARVEIKNISGFKEIEKALEYELIRQKSEVQEKRDIITETRAWNSEKEITVSLRKKETEEEYGYIIDPDLPIIELTHEVLKKALKDMPELPEEKKKRYVEELNISESDAEALVGNLHLSKFFEKVIPAVEPAQAAPWVRKELIRIATYNKKEIEELKIKPKHIVDILQLIKEKKITDNVGKKIIEKLATEEFDVKEYVKKQKLATVSDSETIKKLCQEAIEESPEAVKDYRAGSEKALNYIIGVVMKKTRGAAKPETVKEELAALLA